MAGLRVRGHCGFRKNGVDDAEGDYLITFDSWVLYVIGFKMTGKAFFPVWCGLALLGVFWARGGHPGSGSPKIFPIPEKPTLSQVVIVVAWISDHFELCACTPGGY